MKYCSKCGKELVDEAIICIGCGVPQRSSESGSVGYFFLGFFIPFVGIILYFLWKEVKPKSAKNAGLGAISIILLYVQLAIFNLLTYVI